MKKYLQLKFLGPFIAIFMTVGLLSAASPGVLTIFGDRSSGGSLRLQSTKHAIKGKIYLGAGTTNYFDETTGAFVGASFSTNKVSGVAGLMAAYEALTTSVLYQGWMGAANLTGDRSYAFQFGNAEPAAGQVMAFAAPTGTGDPNGNPISAQTWVTPILGTYGATANTIGKRGADATTVAASGITEDGMNVSLGALNLVSTGTISGGMPLLGTWASPITSAGAYALSAANSYGRWIYYNDTDEITLPAAVATMSVCIQVPAATLVPVGPNGTDVIVLDGTALSAGQAYSIAAVAGNFSCLIADAANHWVTAGGKGTLTAIP